jgi:hypothetical protein
MAEKRREIDWAGAEVKDGSVVLPLSGDASKAGAIALAACSRCLRRTMAVGAINR